MYSISESLGKRKHVDESEDNPAHKHVHIELQNTDTYEMESFVAMANDRQIVTKQVSGLTQGVQAGYFSDGGVEGFFKSQISWSLKGFYRLQKHVKIFFKSLTQLNSNLLCNLIF